LRVIAGRARAIELRAPRDSAVRPTSDKLKGAIFSMLEAEAFKRGIVPPEDAPEDSLLSGAAWPTVLDLYAGSGALGIEALSRGARWADFVEHDRATRATILTNLERTRLKEYAGIHGMKVETAISTWTRTYDLIFLDPPYADPALPTVLVRLGRSRLIGEQSVVVLEHARTVAPPATAERLVLSKTRYHGASGVSFYLVSTPPG
jgi:16S rRNA (guanine966-N2)-methyltransferase